VTQQLRAVITVALRSGFDAGTSLERGAISLVDDDEGRTATALVVVFDPARGELTWANAGHLAPWLLHADEARPGPPTFPLTASGPLLTPLGGSWSTSRVAFEVDDVVLAWSDGLVESRDAAREVSDADLAALLAAIPTREPRLLVPAVLAGIRQRAEDWSRDDVTLIGVRRQF
jgi:serine phosphatase RsbU (regulator of sigma subunit)